MMKNIRILLIITMAIPAMMAGPVMAEKSYEQKDNNSERQHRKPPQEAFDACKNSTKDAACTVTGRRGKTLTGVCLMPRGDQLICVPERRLRKQKNRKHDSA